MYTYPVLIQPNYLVNSDILCLSFDTLGFRHAMTMAFAIDEINNNSHLLSNVTLGYSLYDNCGALVVGFTGALSLASGREGQFLLQENCLGSPPVLGIVGDHYSTFSIAMANVLGLYKMPIVSFLSLISCSVVFLVYIYRLSLSLTLLKYDCSIGFIRYLTGSELTLRLFVCICFFIGELFCHVFLFE